MTRPATLAVILAPDPFPVAALLRARVEAHCIATGELHRDVAARAGLRAVHLSRALREGHDSDAPTVRRILGALRMHVEIVPDAVEPRNG